MELARLKRIPRYTYTQSLKRPVFPLPYADRAVFGFDTEYDSTTGELLSVQLFRPGVSIFKKCPRRFRLTYDNLRKLIPHFRNPFLVAFFALADISKISDWWDAKIDETGLGMIYAEKGDMTIFDIGVFWSSDRGFSLAKLGKVIGIEKLKWDRSNVTRSDLDKPGFKKYAMRDAEICYYGYEDFLRSSIWRLFKTDITNFRSAPAISARIFREKLTDVIIPPLRSVRRMSLSCYWGGRSEVFHRGIYRGRVTELDANSEYPRSAIELGSLPNGHEWERIRTRNIYKYIDGFVRVLFAYPERFRGFFGLPVNHNHRLYWPRFGESYCTLTELRTAIQFCPRMSWSIQDGWGYRTASIDDLNNYLSMLLVEKDKATGADRFAYKLLANSIIGKLAQNRRVVDNPGHIQRAADMGVPGDYLERRPGDCRIQVGNCYWPEAASLILGKARAVLFSAMNKAGRSRCLLCSTDSIIVKGSMPEFVSQGVPFEIEHVGDKIRIWREKVYAMFSGSDVVKVAHHAMPARAVFDKDGSLLLGDSDNIDVEYREFVKLYRASMGYDLGSTIDKIKTVTLKPSKYEGNFV